MSPQRVISPNVGPSISALIDISHGALPRRHEGQNKRAGKKQAARTPNPGDPAASLIATAQHAAAAAEMAAGDAESAPPAAAAQSLVESFCAVTSATPQEAAFFLESHNWALESAVRSFYDSAEGDADAADPVAQPAAGDGTESEDEDYAGGDAGDDEEEDEDYVGDDDDEDAALAAAAAAAEERRRPSKRMKKSHDAPGGSGSGSRPTGASGRGNVRTLSDLGGGKREAGSDEDLDEDDEWAPPPELYAGGEKR
jgi:UBX domain-containing protein 1